MTIPVILFAVGAAIITVVGPDVAREEADRAPAVRVEKPVTIEEIDAIVGESAKEEPNAKAKR